jgi:hypothetical protein
VEVNSLTSVETELPFDYYSLPFCKPAGGVKRSTSSVNPGTILSGLRMFNSPYVFKVHVRSKTPPTCAKIVDSCWCAGLCTSAALRDGAVAVELRAMHESGVLKYKFATASHAVEWSFKYTNLFDLFPNVTRAVVHAGKGAFQASLPRRFCRATHSQASQGTLLFCHAWACAALSQRQRAAMRPSSGSLSCTAQQAFVRMNRIHSPG